MTSLAFMFVLVPAPPWIMSTTNWLWRWPSMISAQAEQMASATSSSSRPRRLLAMAAAFFTMASARMKSGKWDRGIPVMWKFSLARSVWMP